MDMFRTDEVRQESENQPKRYPPTEVPSDHSIRAKSEAACDYTCYRLPAIDVTLSGEQRSGSEQAKSNVEKYENGNDEAVPTNASGADTGMKQDRLVESL
jgi:hypothetical protein